MKIAPVLVAAALAAAAVPASGCYGKYTAFHKVHKWNGGVTASRIANSAIHFGLWILPVYELVILGDILIFNTVETFTGKNPLE
jgi:hypothetical protein